jgi:hypothetical protein
MIVAFSRLLHDYDSAFPQQTLVMMTSANAFPSLGEDSRPDPTGAGLPESAFSDLGERVLRRRFVVQVNNLRADHVDVVAQRAAQIGFQVAWPVTGDRACRMQGGHPPCNALSVFSATMTNAMAANAVFIELFKEDITNPAFGPAIGMAHRWFHR